MIITIPENTARLGLLIVNSLFIAAGISMIVHGAYMQFLSPRNIDGTLSDNQSDGTTSIVAGVIDLIIGIVGLVGALMKMRILLVINMSLLAISILSNFIILAFYVMTNNDFAAEAKVEARNLVVYHYGNNSDVSKEVTVSMDAIHSSDDCCGWSGDEAENLYVKSPWYTQINLGIKGKERTVPDTCCITAGDECRATTNIKEARKMGYVKLDDCLDKMLDRAKMFMWMTILQLMLVTVLQMMVLAFTVLTFLQGEGGG